MKGKIEEKIWKKANEKDIPMRKLVDIRIYKITKIIEQYYVVDGYILFSHKTLQHIDPAVGDLILETIWDIGNIGTFEVEYKKYTDDEVSK